MVWPFSPRRRRPLKLQLSRSARLEVERLGCDQLERRVVLDGLPVLGGGSLTLDPSITPSATAQFGDFTYEVVAGAVTITKYTGSASVLEIPAEIAGSPVTSIGIDAFRGSTSLTSVRIPEGVTNIGDSAFRGCSGLASVTIPQGVTSIGSFAFRHCSGLTSVAIPEGVTSIGSGVFYGCAGLTSFTIPDSATSIGSHAFRYCSGLTGVAIPITVTRIGEYAFQGCTSLTGVKIPEGVTSIGFGAFYGCTGLTSVTIPQGVTSIDYYAFRYCSGLASVTIPEGVTSIGEGAFEGCTSLTGVKIPEGVTSIGIFAFRGCDRLTSVAIPSSVTSIGFDAFRACSGLQEVIFLGLPPSIGDSVFVGTQATIYFLPGRPGWSDLFAARPAAELEGINVRRDWTFTLSGAGGEGYLVKRGPGTLVLVEATSFPYGTFVQEGTLIVRNSRAIGGGGLTVAEGARVIFETGGEAVELTSLELAPTAEIELGGGRISMAAGGYSESAIRQSLQRGFNGGLWNGGGGIRNSGAPYFGGGRAIGYRIAGGALELSWVALGDTNLDGELNAFDLVATQAAGKFNKDVPATWQDGDVNYDGRFNILDLVATNSTGLFGKGSYLPQAPAPQAIDPMWVFAALAEEADDE